MSPDRHADRLYGRLAGGAELTADERRHVATCAACQRAVADVGRLDEQLRTASASLASEPIPDADLEPLEASGSGWMAPLSVVIAVGLVGIVIGLALGQLRPPTGADATPTPQVAVDGSGTPVPSSSAAASEPPPEPSPTPMPERTPPPIPLAAGGQTCADGTAGFSMVVPDGWYANLRQGGLMACSYLARDPFDPMTAEADPAFDAPIRLTTSRDPEPEGTVVDQAEDTWTVERGGEQWLVEVVELFATVDDEPVYLHLAADAADQAATDALTAIHEGLAIGDPLFVDPDAILEADDMFAVADVCSDLDRGVNVILPDEWWTNTVFGDLQACSYFAPDEFAIDEPGAIPDGVAITLELVDGEAPSPEAVIGLETLVVDRYAARRWELTPDLDTRTYQYVIELGDTPSDGPSLVVTVQSERADDYERDKAILDEMMRRLIISPTPAFVRDLEPLPSCGWELVQRTVEGDLHDADARACLWNDYEEGQPSELISTFPTVEGTIVREIYRLIGPGEIEWIIDTTHDHLGTGHWQLVRCTELEPRGEDEITGAILFAPNLCDDPIVLEP